MAADSLKPTARVFNPTVPAMGLHLLDVMMSGGQLDDVRRMVSTRHAALSGLGWRHTVLAPGARAAGQIDCGGVPLPGSGGYRLPLGRQRLARLMEAARPDLIEVADPYTLAWAALQAGQRLGVPTIAFCHGNLPALAARLAGGPHGMETKRGAWAARRAQAYLADLYSGFDLVLAPSKGMVHRLRQLGLRQVHHQPLGVDCDTFNPMAADPVMRDQIVKRLGVAPSTRLLLYTGRFGPEKNLDLLAQAVDLLGPGHLLVAVGAGPCPPRGDRVRVMSPRTNSKHLARMLANADLYVHAGDQEAYGLGALEAMACGLPVLLSAFDGLGELAKAGGISLTSRNPRDWAEAMAYVLDADLDAVRNAALAHAQAHDWNRVHGQMVQRYQWLVQQDAHQRQQVGRRPALVAASPIAARATIPASRLVGP